MSILKRSQAIMEFLIANGWAIIVVVMVIGALAYIGVLNPDKFIPYKCSFSEGIVCLDSNVEPSRIVLVLKNTIGDSIAITQLVVSGNNGQCSITNTTSLGDNRKAIFTISGCNNGRAGERFKGNINLTYTREQLLSHKIKGIIIRKISVGANASSLSICQNAADSGLCEGLDIVFGIGYRNACCSERSLCC